MGEREFINVSFHLGYCESVKEIEKKRLKKEWMKDGGKAHQDKESEEADGWVVLSLPPHPANLLNHSRKEKCEENEWKITEQKLSKDAEIFSLITRYRSHERKEERK